MDRTSYTAEEIRELFNRRAAVTARHRAAVTRLLGFTDKEAEALAQLARRARLTTTELGDLLGLSSGGISSLAQRLERAGHVTRQPHPRDGRSSILAVNPDTIRTVQDHYKDLIEDIDRVTDGLAAEERQLIGRYLEELVATSERWADEATAAARGDEEHEQHEEPEPVELWA